MTRTNSYYITTAISYTNGSPHLGHAYEAVITDAMARFKRLDGYDVKFLTGTDEHGEKILTTAQSHGEDVASFTERITQEFIKLAKDLNISNDDFIRTTQNRHIKAAQYIWQKIYDAGDIYLDSYAGWYSVRDEAYFGEDELKEGEDGYKYTADGARVIWKEEPSYFFKLSKYQDKLLELYQSQAEFITPESRRNEIMSFVKGGLKDLSVSRTSFDWGVPVPNDPDHVMYVWLDALTNYITAIGYPDTDSEGFMKYWPANCHVIGKDIIRFHTIYWPAFLMSAGIDLPQNVFAHGFINIEGQKMSKSVGNVLSPYDLIRDFGLDQTRYILLREVPHGQDGNFSRNHAIERINSDLANGLGNLAQRTLSMIFKNCESQIPEPGTLTKEDQALINKARKEMIPLLRDHMESFTIHKAIEVINEISRDADGYIDAQAPWKLKKEAPERMKTVLYTLAETIRCLAVVMQPFTPQGALKILDQLMVPQEQRMFEHVDESYALKPGTPIEKPSGVFPRIVENERAAE